MTPVVMLKLLAYFDLLVDRSLVLSPAASGPINALHGAQARPSLLELSEMLRAMGYSGHELLFNSYCCSWGGPIAGDWAPETVWPFFAHHLDHLVLLLAPLQTRDYWFDRTGLYRAIATLPTPPAAVVDAPFALALGTGLCVRV